TNETLLRQALGSLRGAVLTAINRTGAFIYTGTNDGRLSVSSDGGSTWQPYFSINGSGAVERFWVDPNDPRVALAVLGSRPRDASPAAPAVHVVRTINGGGFWDDITTNLPDAAAAGSLVSVVGAKVEAARAGDLAIPVLAADDSESQVQIPFEARGNTLSLALDGANGRRMLAPLPLEPAAPVIFVDRDGSPMLLDADSGVMLDAMKPARSRSHIQILATGLGRVKPDWPTGLAAPLENPPQVAGVVHAWLDRTPVEVTRAVLAPGYIGFYLIEIEIPKIVNYGPAELYLDVDGQASNRVRVYIEP